MIPDLFLAGSSQWAACPNLTSKANILRLDDSAMELSGPSGSRITLPLVKSDFHLLLPFSMLLPIPPASHIATTQLHCSFSAIQFTSDKWSSVCWITDRLHTPACGQNSFSKMRLLLTQNGLWSTNASIYLCLFREVCPLS